MDKDYENFVGRMGSFEDEIDLSDLEDELTHYGKLGMKWGHRKAPSKSHQIKEARKRLPTDERNFQKADARFKAAMKKDRMSIASYNEVAKAFNKAQTQRANTFSLAQQKTGGEKVATALGTIGALSVASLAVYKFS